MNKHIHFFIFLILILSIIIIPGRINKYFIEASELDVAQLDKSRLEAELANLEREIAQKQKELDSQKGQSASITRDINILTTQINQAKLDIRAKDLTIKKLGGEIQQKNVKIKTLTEKITIEKESLAQLIRKSREIDDRSFIEFLLSRETIAEAYGDIDTFASVNSAIKKSIQEITGVRVETELNKKELEYKKTQETDVKVALENQKKKVEQNEKEKKTLLSISKNKEAEYSKILAERATQAAKIRARLFELAGGISGGGIEFGDAVEYAEYASSKTGVRTAFILGILKQETNIGKNVGLCYLSNPETGESVGMNTGRVFKYGMKPTRDVKPFLEITKKLGIDPYKTRISCPLLGVSGWGGAMGPSQFIPSTWALFANRIASNFGISFANPWNPQHAIMATAIYLQDLGASKGGFTAERNAACKYYSGRSCDDPKVKNLFYGNAVMSHASAMEEEIKFIEEN